MPQTQPSAVAEDQPQTPAPAPDVPVADTPDASASDTTGAPGTDTDTDTSDPDVELLDVDALAEEQLDVEADRHELPQTFADFDVQDEIVRALADVGITHPFPIQALTLPVALARHDIIGQAKTGTGKTLGFGIPLIQGVVGPGEPGWDELRQPGLPQALVIVPTRELASQVAGDLETAARHRSARVLQVYGGRAFEPQIEALRRGVEVVVGTPGRMLDLMRQRALDLSHVRCAVLDEADEMLDLGFLPDVEALLGATAASRHTMLFSATMPGAVVALARRYMSRPTHIRAHDPHDEGATLSTITQFVYRAHALDKVEVLARILQSEGRGLTLVFARTKRTAARVAEDLGERGFAAGSIHGDLGQGAREQALRAFRKGKIDVLVATDVAARGIDVENITHVVNYQCPEDEKTYIHRIGRTGRAGSTGTAVTFVDWDDVPRWRLIDKALDLGKPEPVETYSTSPHLFSDLHVPAGITGTLPRSARTRAGLEAEEVEDLGETGRRGDTRSRNERGGGSGRDPRGGRSSGGGAQGSHAESERRRQRRRRSPGDGQGTARTDDPNGTTREDAAAASGGASAGGESRPRRGRRRTRGGRPVTPGPEDSGA
jgi:superfamily II DNA/RNA helicase